jgi:hypothetical protein
MNQVFESKPEFRKGDKVAYYPRHVKDRRNYIPETGIVTSMNLSFVFVRFFNDEGDLAETSQPCSMDDIAHIHE